jgi:endonuclease YncB( thermonuclease family)
MKPRLPYLLLVLPLSLLPLAAAPTAVLQGAESRPLAPTELFEVTRVVDGDTIHIRRAGELQKLRLLSVDTEEKLSGNPNLSPTKPETVFGEECALWAQEFFDGLAEGDARPQVGLRFPGGVEKKDIYGRVLCHVVLPDGRDFNLLLVELGKSPYFNKYGNSLICHEELVAAQATAQAQKLGIWNPATNAAARPGAPEARRPYDALLPWWRARAQAIDDYRAKHAADAAQYVEAEDVAAMAAAAALDAPVHVFGSPYRLFDEENGDWTVLFRATERERALRVRVAAADREAFAALDVAGTLEEFRQNYVWVRGKVIDTDRGFEIRADDPAAWTLAGPEPAVLEAVGAGR